MRMGAFAVIFDADLVFNFGCRILSGTPGVRDAAAGGPPALAVQTRPGMRDLFSSRT